MSDSSAFAARLALVRERIAEACVRAGRQPDEVTLIAVSKTQPPEAVAEARAAGVVDFGENRVQELVQKATAFPGESEGGDLRWHLIGPLQRNKVRDALAHADLFHALDSFRLAESLDRKAAETGRVLDCLVQVNVSGEASKSGVAPEEAHALVDAAQALAHLRVTGLMTIAAPAENPAEIERVVRPQLALLRKLGEAYRGEAALGALSMGMSGDLEAAIAEGATHVRVGTALFGSR